MLSLLALWIVVGWCGTTRIFHPWWGKHVPSVPDPPPRPNYRLIRGGIGAVGGVVGGWVFAKVFGPSPEPWGPHPEPWLPMVVALATSFGAYLGAHVLTDIYSLVRTGVRSAEG